MRRASVAGIETQGPVFSFGRRLSLTSLGSEKYGRADDSYGDRERVIVRHVPIVIEGESEEEEEVKESVTSVADDDSSLSSDNSVETSSVRYQSWDDWRKRGRRDEAGDDEFRTPLMDIKQLPVVKKKSESMRPALTPGPWYILKAETVGVECCPVHREREGAQGNKPRNVKKPSRTIGQTHGTLRAPSLIQGRNGQRIPVTQNNNSSVTQAGRPKHSTIPRQPATAGFERGPGQRSFRGIRFKTLSDTQKDEKETIQDSRKSDIAFQRRWSFRVPSVTQKEKASDIPSSFQAPTIASLSRSLGDRIPEYFRGSGNASQEKQECPIKKCSSNPDLNRTSASSMTAFKSRITPSSSTSSNPSKIVQEKSSSAGILKTPGKRKVSNNRVEFLNNIMEREIPGRHT